MYANSTPPPLDKRLNLSSGFTLIELSIVLVIIGLLVGGVLVGQDLIRAAELRSLAREIESFQTQINTFKLKYAQIPGDISNATSFGFTGNGNNDGKLLGDESYRAWQHLSEAGLISETYTGAQGAAGSADCVPGSNCPIVDIKSVASRGKVTMIPRWISYSDPNNGLWWLGSSNRLFIGTDNADPTINAWPLYQFLTGLEAYNLDAKVDDGRAGTGKYKSSSYSGSYAHGCEGDAQGSNTSVTAADQEAFYRTHIDDKICSFMIDLDF